MSAFITPDPESYLWTDRPCLSPVQVIKACHCLAYQSCERPDWETSDARTILHNIESAACSKLPGYEQAKWSIDEELQPGVVTLTSLLPKRGKS